MATETTAAEAAREPTAAAAPGRPRRPRDGSVPKTGLAQAFPALANARFRRFWLGMSLAPLAWQMYLVASGFVAFSLSGTAVTLGLVSLSVGGPMFLFALVGGVVADRLPRVAIIVTTQTVLALTSAVLSVLTLAGRLEVWHLVVAGLFQGTCFAFNVPARQAFSAELVPPRLLGSAVALQNAGMNFSRIAGPALAGLLLSSPIGAAGVMISMTVMYGAIILALVGLSPAANTDNDVAIVPREAPRQRGGWAQLVEGLAYIRSSPTLLVLLALAFAPPFFGMPYQTLMPLFAERVYGVGAAGLATALAAVGAGALSGSLAAAALAGYSRPERLQSGFGIGFGLALVGFALAPSFVVALGFLVVVGFTFAAYGSLNNALVMRHTEPRLHGRVMSVYMMSFAVMPVASVPASWLADHFGGPIVVASGGLLVVVAVLVLGLVRPVQDTREA